MQLIFVQFMTGLASAASLFLVASGLSIIFGVTRIVNFAHGAFYMLGAYFAYTLTTHLEGSIGFWFAIVAAALITAAVGALLEMLLLRRIYGAPELFQLLATFGVTLAIEDLVILIWGSEDLVGPRAPGLRGAILMFGKRIPSYDLLLIALGPIVLIALWLLFHRTRWGVLVRAATQDRDMVAALGVNQKWLFTSVFALGTFLAALGGALQIPRDAVNHAMDLPVIVEIFVVVVIGGLGSTTGAFLAAIIVSELNAFGILVLPKISLVLVFVVMAVVLVAKPYGLLGKAEAATRVALGAIVRPWRPLQTPERIGMAACARDRCRYATVSRRLWAERRRRNTDLRAVRGEPASSHDGRRPRLVRPRRLFRSWCLWRGAGGEIAASADAAGDPGRADPRDCRRRDHRLVRGLIDGRLFRDADAGVCADRLVDRLPMGRGHRRRQWHPQRLAGCFCRNAVGLLFG